MIEFFGILMSWASTLSGYPMPTINEMPVVRYVSHEFFVENVCVSETCNVHGWYNDNGIVYIANYIGVDSGYESSVVVHEFVHFLQHKSGLYDTESCPDSLLREREAYGVQNAYFIQALARFQSIKPGPTRCVE